MADRRIELAGDELFSQKAGLFELSNKEWKPAGTGEVKLLQHSQSKEVFCCFRPEHETEFVAQHCPSDPLHANVAGPDRLVLSNQDNFQSDGCKRIFALKFQSTEEASEFSAQYDKAREINAGVLSDLGNRETNSLRLEINPELNPLPSELGNHESKNVQVKPLPDMSDVLQIDPEADTSDAEEELFNQVSKLSKLSKPDEKWMLLGEGHVKLTQHRVSKKVRFQFRNMNAERKANHYVLDLPPFYCLNENIAGSEVWVWCALDYAHGTLHKEIFGLRFKSPAQASGFKCKFEQAKQINSNIPQFASLADSGAPAIVDSPDAVEIEMGSKLYRFDGDKWKELGCGVAALRMCSKSEMIRFVFDNTTGTRVANHHVVEHPRICQLKPIDTNKKIWAWVAKDCPENSGQVNIESFALVFGTAMLASVFKEHFERAKRLNSTLSDLVNFVPEGSQVQMEQEEREEQEKEQEEREHQEREQQEREQQEREQQEREQQEKEQQEKMEQQEREQQEREQQEREQQEREQQEREQQEREWVEIESQKREQQERTQQEREQQERLQREREQQERERQEGELQEKEQQEREHQEREQQERELQEGERLEKEAERVQKEAERVARESELLRQQQEQLTKGWQEFERQKQERERQERERQATERQEKDQQEKELNEREHQGGEQQERGQQEKNQPERELREREHQGTEQQERGQQEKGQQEWEQQERQRVEIERREREKQEKLVRQEKEILRLERERLEMQKEQLRLEKERLRIEKEQERVLQERPRLTSEQGDIEPLEKETERVCQEWEHGTLRQQQEQLMRGWQELQSVRREWERAERERQQEEQERQRQERVRLERECQEREQKRLQQEREWVEMEKIRQQWDRVEREKLQLQLQKERAAIEAATQASRTQSMLEEAVRCQDKELHSVAMRYREAQDRARKAEEEQTQVLRELIELRKQQDDDGEELERLRKEGRAEPALVEDARQQLKIETASMYYLEAACTQSADVLQHALLISQHAQQAAEQAPVMLTLPDRIKHLEKQHVKTAGRKLQGGDEIISLRPASSHSFGKQLKTIMRHRE